MSEHVIEVEGESIVQCDLCNTEVTEATSQRISRAEFHRLIHNGFNPFTENITISTGSTLADLAAAFGLAKAYQYQMWKMNALASNADWILCDRCYHLAKRYSR